MPVISSRQTIKPLVVTPRPYYAESFNGFLLRTAESNSYGSYGPILEYAGVTEKELRSVQPPFHKLAKVYACEPEALHNLSYFRPEEFSDNKGMGLLGHELLKNHFQIRNPKFCPDCVSETGRVTVYWDLGYTVACPVHGRHPVTRCDKCKKPISWRRPGLLTCRCGADLLTNQVISESNQSLLAFMQVIRSKLFNLTLNTDPVRAANFPLDEFENMSLRTLLCLVDRIGKQGEKLASNDMAEDQKEYRHVKITSEVFSNWPHNFYDFLEKIGNYQDASSNNEHYGFIKQFEHVHNALFKTKLPAKEIEFIYREFFIFGDKRWKKATIDKRLREKNPGYESTLVGIDKASEIMGVQTATVRRLVELGVIKAVEVKKGNRKRLLFDVGQDLPKRIDKGVSYSARQASKVLKLPVSVLQELRKRSVFKMRYFGDKIQSFHEYDVIAFKRQLEALCDAEYISDEVVDTITLDDAMKRKYGSEKYKADIVELFLSGKIRTLGSKDKNIENIEIDTRELNAILKDVKEKGTDSLLVVDAARKIGCDPTVVPWLVRNDYLKANPAFQHLRIESDSIDHFKSTYLFCNELGKEKRTSSKKIIQFCERHGIEMFRAMRTSSSSSQPFISLSDLKSILPAQNYTIRDKNTQEIVRELLG
ncbi:TniQ family protein [Thiohalophilus sp.]|uniref:TniQ family protein n=1 Tax=Thiohalophilus sp. TaxID=3028392 RepID=UPI002ACE0366|nr:TniQ family protein [Thiohalophilus sp.]MDZ7660926.1 TniQ family protein [Thiohalophilus sp.]